MYRLLIADDEALEREGLEMMIQRTLPGTFEIFHAENGREAIEVAEEHNLDFAFMDIKMPGINGLDAIKRLLEVRPKVKVVLVTAYDYFGYAKDAVSLGVKDYLLKPADLHQVVDILQKLISEIDQEKDRRQKELLLQEKLAALLPIAESEMALLLTTNFAPEQDFRNLAEILEFPIEKGYGAVLSLPEIGHPLLQDKKVVHEAIRGWLKSNLACIVGPIIGSQIAVFVSLHQVERSFSQRIESIEWAEKLCQWLEGKYKVKPLIGIGTIQKDLEGLRYSYREAVLALTMKDESITIRHYDDLQLKNEEDGFTINEEHQLIEALGCHDLNNALQIFTRMFEALSGDGGDANTEKIRRKLRMLFEMLNRHLVTAYHPVEFAESHGIDQLKQAAERQLQLIVDRLIQEKGKKVTSAIERAKEFINQNFADELSLEMTAEYVNLSPYYFSKIFKSESGQNFSDYLTERRITKSKELMGDASISLKEVCYLVGYKDPNYFSRVFKRVTGITPTEFKNPLFR